MTSVTHYLPHPPFLLVPTTIWRYLWSMTFGGNADRDWRPRPSPLTSPLSYRKVSIEQKHGNIESIRWLLCTIYYIYINEPWTSMDSDAWIIFRSIAELWTWRRSNQLFYSGSNQVPLKCLQNQRGRSGWLQQFNPTVKKVFSWSLFMLNWESNRRFAKPLPVFPRNGVWETSAEISYWWSKFPFGVAQRTGASFKFKLINKLTTI